MKKVFFLILVIFASCTSPSVIVKNNANIQKLGIHFEGGAQSNPLIADQFEQILDDFIDRYNAREGSKFTLYRASPTDSCSLRIKLVTTSLVTPGQQTTGVIVSILGLSLPIVMVGTGAPMYLGFYYFPKVKSLTELSLSPDIDGSGTSYPKRSFLLSSPGFLMSPERQIDNHVLHFNSLLIQLVSQLERQTKRKRSNTLAKQ